MKKFPNVIPGILLGAALLLGSVQAQAEMYKYLDSSGNTLLTEKRMGRGYQLVKIYKIKTSNAYKSSLKPSASDNSSWRIKKKTGKKYKSQGADKNLVKANGRATGVLRGCGNRSHLKSQARTYAKTISIYSRIYGVDEELIHAIVKQESCFNEGAHSHVGAIGLMQLMPGTALDMSINDPWNPEHNIQGGVKYIAQMLDMFDGNMRFAIAAYNAGPGNVSKYRGIPPFRETRNYVKKVYAEYKRLKAAGISKPAVIELAALN